MAKDQKELWQRFRQWYLLVLLVYLSSFLGWLVTHPFRNIWIIGWLNLEFSLLWLLLPNVLIIFYGIYRYRKGASTLKAIFSALLLYLAWRISHYVLQILAQTTNQASVGDRFGNLGWTILLFIGSEIVLALPFVVTYNMAGRH